MSHSRSKIYLFLCTFLLQISGQQIIVSLYRDLSRRACAMGEIGKSIIRKEGKEKITGQARYIDDITFRDMIYGATVRSPIPRGLLRNIFFGAGIPWNEFTIVTAQDIIGSNYVELIATDQPFLVHNQINHPEEPIVLLAHPSKDMLEKGRAAVKFDIDPLPPILSIEDSLTQKEIIWGSDNLLKSCLLEKGNVDAVWEDAAFIIEDSYETGAQEQLYIENQGVIAIADQKTGITVWGSIQCPYYIHKALMTLFSLPTEKIRVIQAETGGGFGGKEEYPTMISGHAALLAMKSGKPVKIIYSRSEDMAATTKRHPSRTKIKMAADKDGILLGIDIDFALDGGAYVTLSPVVLSRGSIHACGVYYCENLRVRGRAVATNTPPHGAFRGFGAPQSTFAIERHMNKAAKEIGIAPEEFRRRNFIKQGQSTATKQIIQERIDFDVLLNEAFRVSDYHEKLKQFALHNQTNKKKKGIGFASFMHGVGFTGSGELYLASRANVEADKDGRIHVLASSTEIGQGTNTIFSQIAADALGISSDDVDVVRPDTKFVPDSGPTVASRTCSIVGKLVENAAMELRQTLISSGYLKVPYNKEEFKAACKSYYENIGPLKGVSQYKPPKNFIWDDKTYTGDAYASYGFAVYVAEITVNPETYETSVDNFYAIQEVGQVINPVLATGQIEGGVVQGIGYTLYEKVVWKEGRMINNQMTNYIIPTARDTPPIHVHFEEWNKQHGPQGAKGIGELPLDGTSPAIINAVENAIGISINAIPMLPEDLFKVWEGKSSSKA
jgi:CO/xanthine dehydrogenase Mo-binding subunit